MTDSATATLLISFPECQGLVAKIANFVYANGGNIIHADHHTDFTTGLFLSRIEWQLEGFNLSRELIGAAFDAIARPLGGTWQLHFSNTVPNLAIFVSRQDHCLYDLILRQKAKEFIARIAVIISNHETLKPIAEQFGIDFYHIPIAKENKLKQELKQLEILNNYQIDLAILAKYMQVLSPDFIHQFPQIINIHHSFLPAFIGAKPYHKAYARGVKIIGATAHYVTENLDAGPIIEQNVVRVSHRDGVKDLIREGKDLERIVLAKAVRLHLQHRILVYGNRTVVFD